MRRVVLQSAIKIDVVAISGLIYYIVRCVFRFSCETHDQLTYTLATDFYVNRNEYILRFETHFDVAYY
jgi:hypothetical protein